MPIKIIFEIVLLIFFVSILILLWNPMHLWMPSALLMSGTLAIAILTALITGFFWKEQARDERELVNRMSTDRFAYFTGIAVLTLGIITQNPSEPYDPRILAGLGAMIVAKGIGAIYHEIKH